MKKNILTIMKKEFARFFGDKRLVFTTILMPGLMIYVMYSFMGNGFASKFNTAEDYVYQVYTVNLPESFQDLKSDEAIHITEIETADEAGAVKTNLENQEADLLAVFPADFDEAVAAYDSMTAQGAAPNISLYYNSVSQTSSTIYRSFCEIFNQYESALANKFDINAAEGEQYDFATEKDTTAEIFSMMLPMLMMVFLFSGCIAIAPESIAGEKERGTIATLLVTPMKRSELALGKILSLSVIGLLSGISSFLGTFVSLPQMMGGMSDEVGMNVNVYSGADFIMLLLVILSTVLLIIGMISIISGLSKSVKEAGTAVTPLMIVVMVIAITSMMGGGAQEGFYWYLIPLYNSVQCMSGIFSFTMLPVNLIITVVINIIYTLLLVGGLTKIFDSEKIMYS